MPLSEHEQRLLDQIERALYAEDPKFASTVRSTDLRSHMRRRVRRAAAVFVVGFGMLLAGIANTAVGIVGFLLMIVALVLALSAWNRLGGLRSDAATDPAKGMLRAVDGPAQRPTGKRKGKARPPRSAGSGGSARERLEERWKKRWDERGGPQ